MSATMDIRNARLRPYAFEGNFGLEREALRLGADGHLARTPHPFPPDHPRIVRDFCECQTEINTRVHPDAASAEALLRGNYHYAHARNLRQLEPAEVVGVRDGIGLWCRAANVPRASAKPPALTSNLGAGEG